MESLEISGIYQFVFRDDVLKFIYFDSCSKSLWIFHI